MLALSRLHFVRELGLCHRVVPRLEVVRLVPVDPIIVVAEELELGLVSLHLVVDAWLHALGEHACNVRRGIVGYAWLTLNQLEVDVQNKIPTVIPPLHFQLFVEQGIVRPQQCGFSPIESSSPQGPGGVVDQPYELDARIVVVGRSNDVTIEASPDFVTKNKNFGASS